MQQAPPKVGTSLLWAGLGLLGVAALVHLPLLHAPPTVEDLRAGVDSTGRRRELLALSSALGLITAAIAVCVPTLHRRARGYGVLVAAVAVSLLALPVDGLPWEGAVRIGAWAGLALLGALAAPLARDRGLLSLALTGLLLGAGVVAARAVQLAELRGAVQAEQRCAPFRAAPDSRQFLALEPDLLAPAELRELVDALGLDPVHPIALWTVPADGPEAAALQASGFRGVLLAREGFRELVAQPPEPDASYLPVRWIEAEYGPRAVLSDAEAGGRFDLVAIGAFGVLRRGFEDPQGALEFASEQRAEWQRIQSPHPGASTLLRVEHGFTGAVSEWWEWKAPPR